MHRLNIRNGKLSSAWTRSPAPNTNSYTDAEGKLLFAIGGNDTEGRQLFKYNSDEEWDVVTAGKGDKYAPIGFDKDYQHVFYIDNPADGETCLYKQELASNAQSKVDGYCGISEDNHCAKQRLPRSLCG